MVFNIRAGDYNDLEHVFRLNCDAFIESWSYEGLKYSYTTGFDLLIAEYQEKFAGYLLTQDILNEVHIMQIAIVPTFQRQGLAQQLTQHLMQQKQGVMQFFLEVRASNLAARQLYKQLGFSETGCRKSYYSPDSSGDREDAILMSFSPSK